jgi:hypothetical protein
MKWDYDGQFLPRECHSVPGFDETMELVTGSYMLWESPVPGKLAPRIHVESYILGIGMLMRELEHVNNVEELGEDIPLYLGESEMQWERWQDLLNACQVLTAILEEEDHEQEEREDETSKTQKQKAVSEKYLVLISCVTWLILSLDESLSEKKSRLIKKMEHQRTGSRKLLEMKSHLIILRPKSQSLPTRKISSFPLNWW